MAGVVQCRPEMTQLEAEHRQWIGAFHRQHLLDWEQMLISDAEAARFEASVRHLLQVQGLAVVPNADLVGMGLRGAEQRPDFHCTCPEGEFFVEVTCLQIATVVNKTGLPHPLQHDTAQNYRSLNDAIFEKCRAKTTQCSVATHPTLLAVGTFHTAASVVCFSQRHANMLLTGTTSVSWGINLETGEVDDTYSQTTALRSASFLKPGQGSIREARTSLSGLLLCGFGCFPPTVLGLLHPSPARRFDPRLLPNIPFGEVQIDQAAGQLRTRWSESGS